MRITNNLKAKLMKAKAQGYKRVYATIGAHKATIYCYFADIDDLLARPTGTDYGPERPYGPWRGWPNTRHVQPEDIQYSRLFEL